MRTRETPADPEPAGGNSAAPDDITGRGIARNTSLNLLGQALPLVVAIVAVPLLISGLGSDGFGVLAIAWMFLGYLSLFDFGLSRALTQLVSDRFGDSREVDVLVWTALTLTFGLGLVVAGIAWTLVPVFAFDILAMPEELRPDAALAFYAIAVAIPFVISTANMRGTLEACHRFGLINMIRIPLGALTFGAPVVVLAFTDSLFAMVLALLAARLAAWLAYFVSVVRVVPSMRGGVRTDRRFLRPLFKFGGWMTVSNVLSPLLVHLDRFLIAALISATAVAYYATPWEVVTRLLLIPTALAAVLFPSFSFWRTRDLPSVRFYFRTGVKTVLLVLFPVVALLIVAARPGLALWIDPAFADESYRVMQILAVGILFNGIAAVPFALIQGMGKPAVTARLHLIELPFYVALLWILLQGYGIVGAAIAWAARVVIDFVALYVLSLRTMGGEATEERAMITTFAAALSSLVVLVFVDHLGIQSALVATLLAAYGIAAWRLVLTSREKAFISKGLRHSFQRS